MYPRHPSIWKGSDLTNTRVKEKLSKTFIKIDGIGVNYTTSNVLDLSSIKE